MDFPEQSYPQASQPRRSSSSSSPSHPQPKARPTRYLYSVEQYSEGAIGTILLGGSKFNPAKLSNMINAQAAQGYRMIFQVKEERRMLLFWKRESIIMTFEKAYN